MQFNCSCLHSSGSFHNFECKLLVPKRLGNENYTSCNNLFDRPNFLSSFPNFNDGCCWNQQNKSNQANEVVLCLPYIQLHFSGGKKMKHKSMRLSLVQKKFQGEHTWMRFYICTHINRQSCTEGVDCSGGFVAHSHVMTDTGTVQV